MLLQLLLVAALASTVAPRTPINSAGLDDEDLTRYGLTYCHMVRRQPFALQHRLASHCTVRIKFFGFLVCVEDPENDASYVPGLVLTHSTQFSVYSHFQLAFNSNSN